MTVGFEVIFNAEHLSYKYEGGILEGQLLRKPLVKVKYGSVGVLDLNWIQPTVMREACFMGKPNNVGPPDMAPLEDWASSRAMMIVQWVVSSAVRWLLVASWERMYHEFERNEVAACRKISRSATVDVCRLELELVGKGRQVVDFASQMELLVEADGW